jgi:hypothetical protein
MLILTLAVWGAGLAIFVWRLWNEGRHLDVVNRAAGA